MFQINNKNLKSKIKNRKTHHSAIVLPCPPSPCQACLSGRQGEGMGVRSKIILGIDPGIADTGFGVIKEEKGGKFSCLDYGSIKTKAGGNLAERLKKIDEDLNKIIKKHRPEIIAVEQLFFCKNVKTALTVGQARGVILLAAQKNNIQPIEFTPLQIKQAVAAYGRASKEQVKRMVKIILGLKTEPKQDDAADALAVAICASQTIKNSL